MVNKQYNVQSLNKNKSNNNNNHNNNRSSITVISTIPPNLNSQQQQQPQQPLNNNNNLAHNDRHQSSIISAFERNITQQYFHHSDTNDLVDRSDNIIDPFDIDPIASINSSVIGDSHKQLSINDIGRFQYILQMDREMVSFFFLNFIYLINLLILSIQKNCFLFLFIFATFIDFLLMQIFSIEFSTFEFPV